MKLRQIASASALCSVVLGLPGVAVATTLDVYAGPTITDAQKDDRRACLNVGDAISCSAGMLNVLTGRDPTNKTSATNPAKWGYVLDSPQGALKNRIVVGTGGNASTDNGDISPSPEAVEDGFKTNNAGDAYSATGKTGSTAGNLADPGNNQLPGAWDNKGTWDVSIDWLINALTIDSVRRELMIGFDYNQSNSNGTLDYWSLITLIDHAGDTSTISKQMNFEIRGPEGTGSSNTAGVAGFTSDKTFESQPKSTEFSTVNTKTCYKLDSGGNVVDVFPLQTGQCPSGYQHVDNAQGDNTTEILAFLPELNAGLEQFKKDGYDTISVRMLFGCFDNSATGNSQAGAGYLADDGKTTNCDGGGNVDVYLLANVPQTSPPIPEPGTIALTGLALAGLGWASRRRKTA